MMHCFPHQEGSWQHSLAVSLALWLLSLQNTAYNCSLWLQAGAVLIDLQMFSFLPATDFSLLLFVSSTQHFTASPRWPKPTAVRLIAPTETISTAEEWLFCSRTKANISMQCHTGSRRYAWQSRDTLKVSRITIWLMTSLQRSEHASPRHR